MPANRAYDPKRVIDLDSYRTARVRVEPDSPELTKHEDMALAIHQQPAQKSTMKDRVVNKIKEVLE